MAGPNGSACKQSQDDNPQPTFVVGVGASAGGLEALEKFFQHVPADTGMAFVVVQHLSPDFESVMDELLVRQTDIPVHTVEDGIYVQPNAIYLIPPKKEMIIADGKLLLTDKEPGHGLTLPIDQFFRSLAQDAGGRAIAIVLSGTGSDGSRGIRDVHKSGGLVIVQSEDSAKFDGMPKSAMETGVVDLVLAPEEMADTLVKYSDHPVAHDLAAEQRAAPVDEGDMNKLMRLLRDAYGIDFSLYKQTTVVRRIERRLLLNQEIDFEHYVEQISSDPDELNSLYRDLLIGVTQFFRDREAFALLETQILPDILSKLKPDDEVRMWVAGCATGEEAYSLAILLHEQLMRLNRPLNAKIFATDVHQASLDFASSGVYSEESLTDVSPDRLKRFFTRKNNGFQVSADLRQMIVFAQHNIIKDAPFTKLDLVTCRNLLIYLQPNVQKKAISLFHFGLKTGGTLFLGPSEGVGDLEDEFTPVDRHWKIYRKRRDKKLPADMRLPVSGGTSLRVTRPQSIAPRGALADDLGHSYDQLLERYVPSGVLIDDQREIIHLFGDAGKYLHFKTGRASTDILELCDGDVRTAIGGAIQRASKERTTAAYSGVSISTDEGVKQVKLSVQPLLDRSSQLAHLLVTFEDLQPAQLETDFEEIDLGEVSRERIALLETELRHSKENLQATVEELETSNEELHATNEELVASNEELQSTNEELHSVNEELYTVNAEYQRKIAELTELTDDMDNLFSSTDIGVLFLDKDLNIRKFTPRIAESFNILEQDIGRSFESFTNNIDHPDLMKDVRWTVKSGRAFEKKVQDRNSHWYLLRILPYRSNAEIEGVILTLVDIQSLRKAEAQLERKDQQLQGILDNSPAFIFIKDLEGRYVLTNQQPHAFLNAKREKVLGKSDYDLLPRDVADRLEAQDRTVAQEGKTLQIEQRIRFKGKPRVFLCTKYPLRNEHGRITSVAGICTDITKQKISERRAKTAVKERDRFLAMLSHELRNPLAAIQNASEYIGRVATGDHGLPKVADVVRRQVEQTTRLLEDLLDVSRIVRRRVDLKKQVVDLRTIGKDAELAVRSLVTAHQLGFAVSMPEEPMFVHGDEGRLQQVFVNVLVNAAKYTPAGGKIEFAIERKDSEAVVTVQDNGIGMSASLIKRVFEPFVQADESLHRSDGGLGVGLALVRSFVDLHDGSVTAASEGKGKGSQITVRLPLTKRKPTLASEGVQQEWQTESQPPLRILVVEDNLDVLDMMKMLFELEGHSVAVASDGISALAAVEAALPDVAFVDIGLPELNGYEVAKRICKKHPGGVVHLVALTGYGQPNDRKRAREAGFIDHLTKPINMNRIREVLSKVNGDRVYSSADDEATK